MLHAENLRDAEQRRLAWRCRRGMLELDIVLQRFVDTHFYDLSLQELTAFDGLLAMQDNEFWALLQQENDDHNVALQSVLAKLNAI
jgi:antitoxin CptB